MNELTNIPGATGQTMSSREIAELVEKRHDNVKRTIDSLANAGLVHPQNEDEPETDAMGRSRMTRVYRVGKRDSYVIVAQLSPEFTARLVDRWQQLEDQAQQAFDPASVLESPAAMRGLLLTYTEKVIALQGEVEEMRPQVQALERIALSEGSMCITDAAKNLQVSPKSLFQFLDSNGWTYTRQGCGTRIAYQAKLQQPLLEHKTTVVTRTDGSEKTTSQVRVTPKGLARLAKEFPPAMHAA